MELEDGTQDGVELIPPTRDYEESWTLLDKDMWPPLPPEQLLNDTPNIRSRQATPVTMGNQDRVLDHLFQPQDQEPHPQWHANLLLDPQQPLQVGRVHVLPNHQIPPQPPLPLQWPRGTDPKYAKRVEELVNSNTLPTSQHMSTIQMAMHKAATEAHRKEHSLATKVKKVFTRK